MTFLAGLHSRAAAVARRIVFPESADERTRAAVAELARREIVRPIVVLDPSAPETHDAVRALGVGVLDPARQPLPESALKEFLSHHAARGITKEQGEALEDNWMDLRGRTNDERYADAPIDPRRGWFATEVNVDLAVKARPDLLDAIEDGSAELDDLWEPDPEFFDARAKAMLY